MLRIEVPVAEADVVADALWMAGASAVAEEHRGDGHVGVVVLTADLDACPPSVTAWPHEVTRDDAGHAWWDGWRPFARAVRAGSFLVRPPWVDAEVSSDAIELVVDAGRAFGTGAHPSTTLTLRALVELVRPGASVLDAGCGSGTLAIGAALLGATRVLAVDVDPEAVTATAANLVRNPTATKVDVARKPVEAVAGTFDVVVANLGAPLVFDLAAALTARCAPGGALVLSGMLGDHTDRIGAAYPTAAIVDEAADDGWTCVVLREPAPR